MLPVFFPPPRSPSPTMGPTRGGSSKGWGGRKVKVGGRGREGNGVKVAAKVRRST